MDNQKQIPDKCPFDHPTCIEDKCIGWLRLEDFTGCFLCAGMRTAKEVIQGLKETYGDKIRAGARALDGIRERDPGKVLDGVRAMLQPKGDKQE